jgi:hypothetical protein
MENHAAKKKISSTCPLSLSSYFPQASMRLSLESQFDECSHCGKSEMKLLLSLQPNAVMRSLLEHSNWLVFL